MYSGMYYVSVYDVEIIWILFLYLVIVVLKNKIIIIMVRFWCLDIRYLVVVVRIVWF